MKRDMPETKLGRALHTKRSAVSGEGLLLVLMHSVARSGRPIGEHNEKWSAEGYQAAQRLLAAMERVRT